MLITDDIYNDLSKRIEAGEFLNNSAYELAGDVTLPQLERNADSEMKVFREQCQQTLDLYQAKIRALQAQLESERKKQESSEALKEASMQTQNFNTLLEDKYDKLLKKSEEDSRSNKKAIKTLQELSDKVLEENKRLKAESDKLQSVGGEEMDDIFASLHSDEEIEEMRKEEEDMMEWQNSISKSIKEVVKFCVNYTSNIDDVADSHVEAIKDMLEDLLESSLAVELLDSDKLELTKSLHSVKKSRKQQVKARNKEAKEKEENRGTTNNNYFAPIGQQVNSARTVKMEKETTKQNNE